MMTWWMWIFMFLCHIGISQQFPDVAGSYSVKICSAQHLDRSQHPPCPLGTGINVTSITFGVRESDESCTQFPSSFTCVRQMEAIYPDEFGAWKQICDGKIVCDNQRAAPTLPVSCDGRRSTADFIEIMYECVPNPPDVRVSSTCVGDYITDLTCRHGYNITITGIYLADNPQPGTCRAAEATYSCAISITSDKSVSFWHTLYNACHNKATCSELVTAEAIPNSTCATVNNVVTDYVIIQYICSSALKYTHRCHGKTFDDLFCPENAVLRIIVVTYGGTEHTLTDEQCRGGAVDNPCYVTRTTPYTKSVFSNCEGNVGCSHEAFIEGTLGACYPGREMQFVQIQFQCVHEIEDSTANEMSTSFPTTPSDTKPTPGTVSMDTVPGHTDSPGTTALVTTIAASAAGAGVLLVIVIVVVIVCVRRKRHTKARTNYENRIESSPSTNNTSELLETSMELNVTSPHSVYSVTDTVRDSEAMCDGTAVDPYAEYNGSQPPRDNTAVTQETDVTAPYSTPNELRHTAQQPVHDDVTAIYSKARNYVNNEVGVAAEGTTTDDVTAVYSQPKKGVFDDEMVIVENDLYHSGGF